MLLPLNRPEYRDTSGFTSSSHSNRRNIRTSPPNSQSRPASVPKLPSLGTYRLVFTMLDPINSSSLVSVLAPFTDSSSEASDRKSVDPFWSSIHSQNHRELFISAM